MHTVSAKANNINEIHVLRESHKTISNFDLPITVRYEEFSTIVIDTPIAQETNPIETPLGILFEDVVSKPKIDSP